MGTQTRRGLGRRLPGRTGTVTRPAAVFFSGCCGPARCHAAGRTGREDPQETPRAVEGDETMSLPYTMRLLCLCCASFFMMHMTLALAVRLSAKTATRVAEHMKPRSAARFLF